MNYAIRTLRGVGVVLLVCGLLGCGGTSQTTEQSQVDTAADGSSHQKPPSTYEVGGTLAGLASGANVILTNNASDTLSLSANGKFAFTTKLADTTSYAVTVLTQPSGQNCTVTNGVGAIKSGDVDSVIVSCTALAPTAKLLFKSNFGPGVSLGPVRNLYATGDRSGAWQDIVGTDKETGFKWPVSKIGAYFSGIQLLTYASTTLDGIGDHITNQIRPVVGPDGKMVNELFQSVKLKPPVGVGVAQAPLIVMRPWNIGDLKDLYISYWFKHQADLVSRLDSTVPAGNWRVQFEFKTGGYDNTSGGDYRFITNILKGTDGKLYWSTSTDNQANGPFGPKDKKVNWTDNDHTTPVPVDTWFKYEVFWHRSSGDDGRFWSAVNGKVIVDHYGANMGVYNLPITRIMVNNPYSGGYPTVESHSTGLEIWDGFPCGVGVSCYSPGAH